MTPDEVSGRPPMKAIGKQMNNRALREAAVRTALAGTIVTVLN
jgi:hypothetical protein